MESVFLSIVEPKRILPVLRIDRAKRKDIWSLGITATMHSNWFCISVAPRFNVNGTCFQQLQEINSEIGFQVKFCIALC